MFFTAASLGLPGLGNFVGEFLIMLGAYKANPTVVIVSATGLVLSAVYSLIVIQRAFHGPAKSEGIIEGLNWRELIMLFSLIISTVWLGLYPQPVLDTSATVIDSLNQLITSTLPAAK
jgi:NADH-quinone oxidoreductase subunit M